MIFVATGGHPASFERLIRRIDEIAPLLNQRVVIQRGFTTYTPKNCEYFDFSDNLEKYYRETTLLISHSASFVLEFMLSYKKPIITVPRLAKYKEHINDHQLEFAEFLQDKTGILMITDVSKLTPKLIKEYKKLPRYTDINLKKLRKYYKELFAAISLKLRNSKQ
jgi:UDP-N-acetylglucosamine transferase subunit ALG13